MSVPDVVGKLNIALAKLEKIKSFYIPPFKPPVKQVDVDWIANRLVKLPNWDWKKWFPLDGKYYTTPLQWFAKIANWDITNYMPYVVDRFDCDKYALLFKARMAQFFGINAVAVVLDYDAGHGYNLVFPEDMDEPLIYEPQTDQFIQISKRNTMFYTLGNNYVVIL